MRVFKNLEPSNFIGAVMQEASDLADSLSEKYSSSVDGREDLIFDLSKSLAIFENQKLRDIGAKICQSLNSRSQEADGELEVVKSAKNLLNIIAKLILFEEVINAARDPDLKKHQNLRKIALRQASADMSQVISSAMELASRLNQSFSGIALKVQVFFKGLIEEVSGASGNGSLLGAIYTNLGFELPTTGV